MFVRNSREKIWQKSKEKIKKKFDKNREKSRNNVFSWEINGYLFNGKLLKRGKFLRRTKFLFNAQNQREFT